ncbi:MAG: NERD domain-containing protein, partial [Mycobacteriaceae bacterium]|nr:NERD domain-containing protein [Mycobacteriaceae bacterium]
MTNDAAGQTERLLAERLSAWTGPGAPRGVACVGAALPADGARVGALVWTPAHCVVIDVVPLSDHRDGDLAIPRHGPWSVDGRPVISTAAGRTPLDQAESRLRAVQAWLGD